MTAREPVRLGVLISGRGSNLQAFIDACAGGALHAVIAVVISNNPDAAGLRKAREAGIPALCIDHREFASREAFASAVLDELHRHRVELVILAGFMRILTSPLLDAFAGRMLNIHPSLLPKYPGLHTHQRALEAGDTEAGVTVHFVTPELDGGPPVIQARVPVQAGDTVDSLAARVIVQEHLIYPLAVQWYVQGRLRLNDQGAYLDGKQIPATGIQYPQDVH